MNQYYQSYKKYITFDHREAFLDGSRWKLAIGTNPCIRTRIKQKCTFCGFIDLTSPLPADEVAQVLLGSLEEKGTDNICRLELYMSGSFFDDVEVSPKARQMIFEILSQTNIPEILIESRPEFITESKLKYLAQVIEPSRVAIAIGVETMNDQIRKYLGKGMTTRKITQRIEIIGDAGMTFQSYLLLKPPYFTDDKTAIISFIQDVHALLRITKEKQIPLIIAVQPMFIADNTEATCSFQQGTFRPPWLYTIAFILKTLDALAAKHHFRIILGSENDNIDVLAIPQNYIHPTDYEVCSCSAVISEQLQQVNKSDYQLRQVVEHVMNSFCTCKILWQQEIAGIQLQELLNF